MSRPIFCTAVPAAGLPRAFLLGETLRRFHGEVDFRVLVLEHPRVVARLRASPRQEALLGPDEIDYPEWLHLAFMYPPSELVAALQPALMRHLVREGDVVYLDADVEIFSPLTEIEEGVREGNVVAVARSAVPHAAAPSTAGTRDGGDAVEARGFDLGVLAVAAGRDRPGAAALDALVARMAEPERPVGGPIAYGHDGNGSVARSRRDLPLSLPAVGLRRLHPPRYGLAHWNAAAHLLRVEGGRSGGPPDTDDGPLVCCHYAGLRLTHAPFSRHRDDVVLPPSSPFDRLARAYRQRLACSPHRALERWPNSLDCYVDGTPILAEHRRAFRCLARPNRRQIVDPFAARAVLDQLIAYQMPLADHLRHVVARVGGAVGQVSPRAEARITHAWGRASNAWRWFHKVLSRD